MTQSFRPAARHPAALLAATLWLALACLPAQAQYMWKDARGQLHVSDQPPPRDVPETAILKRPAPRAAAAAAGTAAGPAASTPAAGAPAGAANPPRVAASAAPVDPELQKRQKLAEQQAREKAQAEEQRNAAIRAENCQRAREQLSLLESGGRIARTNARGEREVMDDAARAREAAQARNLVASECR